MVRLPKLPSPPGPEDIFSLFDKAGDAIEKSLGIIDKVADRFDQVAQKFDPLGERPTQTTTAQKEAAPEQRMTSRGVSPEQLIDYQKGEIGKLLLRMESHYAQRLRIKGIPCDCGAQKHLLDLESLCEETIPMVDNPKVYYRITDWVKEVGPKSTDQAAKGGHYDAEYPTFSHQARDFRKEIIGSIDPATLFPQKPGESQMSLDEAKKLAADEAAKEHSKKRRN